MSNQRKRSRIIVGFHGLGLVLAVPLLVGSFGTAISAWFSNAAVARARATYDAVAIAYQTATTADVPEADAHDEAYDDLIETVPTTVEGLAAVIAFMTYASTDEIPYLRCEEDTVAFFQTFDEALRLLTKGAAS